MWVQILLMATYITKPSYYNVIGGFKPSMRESDDWAFEQVTHLDRVPAQKF